MFEFTYTAAVLAITFAVSAAFLLLKHRRNKLALALSFELIAGALWIGANAGADVAYTPAINIFWSGLCFIGGSFMVSFFLVFVDVFLERAFPSRLRLALYVAPSIYFALFAFSKYSIADTLFFPDAPSAIVPGILYQIYLIFFFSAVFYGFVRLVYRYLHTRMQERYQTAYVTLGFAAFFLGIITFNVLLPLGGEFRFYNVGPQFSLIFFLASAIAVFKHRLIDLSIVVQRGAVYSMLLAIIVSAYLGVLFVLERFVMAPEGRAAVISALVVTIFGIFTVPYLEFFFRRLTDRIFFRDRYDYAEVLEKVGSILNTEVELERLVSGILKTLAYNLRLSYIDFRGTDGRLIGCERSAGFHEAEKPEAFCISIRHRDEDVGIFCIGEKLSGDPFTPEDHKLIATVAAQAAVGIKKAQMYEELKQYSSGLEQKVTERTRHLRDLQRGQRQMIDDISHALQTPLAVIKTTAELLKSEHEHDHQHFTAIERSADNLSRLVSSLLKLARMEADERKGHAYFDLSTLVREVTEYTEVVCTENDIALEVTIEPKVGVSGARAAVEELITNLLSNAVKYTRGSATRRLHVRLEKRSTGACFSVEDSGAGISHEDLPHVFERFYRAKNTERKTEGTGLGLAIARKIALSHGGELTAASPGPGKGSTFTLTLPLAESTPFMK